VARPSLTCRGGQLRTGRAPPRGRERRAFARSRIIPPLPHATATGTRVVETPDLPRSALPSGPGLGRRSSVILHLVPYVRSDRRRSRRSLLRGSAEPFVSGSRNASPPLHIPAFSICCTAC